jgi:methylglutaconyl-CoA hydratase
MSSGDLLVSVKGPIGTITLNRPDQGNSITGPMMAQLLAALDDMNQRPDVRVIVLTAAGKYFCSGMDLKGVGIDAAQAKPYVPFERLWSSKKPVIGAIQGPALGGGVGMMFATDIRVMAAGATISFPEVRLGIYPALISGYIAPQLGPYMTQALMLTGEPCSAERLLQLGAVSKVVPAAEMQAAVDHYTALLLRAPTDAHSGVKRLVRLVNYCGEYHTEVMDGLVQEFGAMMRSPAIRHGMKSFQETKKYPDWDKFYEGKAAKTAAGQAASKL